MSLALRNWLKNPAAAPPPEDAEERAVCACFASENICFALGYLKGKAKRVYARCFRSDFSNRQGMSKASRSTLQRPACVLVSATAAVDPVFSGSSSPSTRRENRSTLACGRMRSPSPSARTSCPRPEIIRQRTVRQRLDRRLGRAGDAGDPAMPYAVDDAIVGRGA